MNSASQAQCAPVSPNKLSGPTGVVSASGLVDQNGNSLVSAKNRAHLGEEKVNYMNRPPANLNEHLDRIIAREEEYLYKLKIAKEKIKELKFKAGDVARHAKYGNVLITNVFCKTLHQESINVQWPVEDSFFQYEITYMDQREDYNMGRPDRVVVPVEELFPITELVETLFR